MKRFFILFSGRVQGVGFRYTVTHIAYRYNLTGYVRNLDNGNVEVQIQGNDDDIDAFLNDLLREKTYIRIDDYILKKIPVVEAESSFKVRY